ncbi:MAG: bifunctional riboflavin kinase/FAD synthetase [Leptospiraceae bacterium]|nr:bifunctional riboflavin kinase/FAD synthetase [Leptospiraceae bacterium]MDW7975509.1 bifunctional riboflavin kinase/FAD synthetase [Leptospiraceae bacterium]
MLIIHDLDSFRPDWSHANITLGVFDGIHIGHQELLKRIQRKRDSYKRILVTYHPHPDIVLGKRREKYGMELFTYEEKVSLLQKYDIDVVVVLPFTQELANTTAEIFLEKILVEKLKAKYIVIGYDQCFGKGREGNFEFLKKREEKYGYHVEQLSPVKIDDKIVSSSRIRELLKAGEIRQANLLLGKNFFITGTVVKGFQRGKLIGFPTANLDVPLTKVIPKIGVYIGYCELGGVLYKAMINIGFNPTFNNQLLSIEAHILNFDKLIYGEIVKFHFVDRIRDEMKFSSVDELRNQLQKDREMADKLPECEKCF